jgi:antitoxin HicB
MADLSQYPFEIRPLSQEEGGGFLISFPDFSECISDGETIDEAIQNGRDALRETIAALESKGYPLPEPGYHPFGSKTSLVSG